MAEYAKQVVLITGASRGLGLALARELAHRGWVLILDARGTESLETVRIELAAHTQVIAVPGDITDAAHRTALVAAVRTVGQLDAIINNASTLGASPRPNLLDYPLDILDTVYRTNVFAPLALLQALRGDLRLRAQIINVTSDAGGEAYEGWGGYGSSKAALEQLSAILATENPDWRVYWVDPGDMQTQMHQDAFPGEDISDRDLPEQSVPGFMALLTGVLPSGRYQARSIEQSGNSSAQPVRGMRLVLTVGDFDRAQRFYRDGLGLPVTDAWLSSGSNGVLFDAGQASLELIDEPQAAEIAQIEVGSRSASQVRLAFTVDDVDRVSSTLQASGAQAISGVPVLTPWGHRNQRLQVPAGIHDGIQLTLSEVVPVADQSTVEQEAKR